MAGKSLSAQKMLSIGRDLGGQGRWADALRIYDRVMEEVGTHDAQSALFSSLPLDESGEGLDILATEQFPCTLPDTGRASHLGLLAEVCIRQSECYMALGIQPAAFEAASSATKYAPSWYKAYYQLYCVYRGMDKLEDAQVAISASMCSSMHPFEWEDASTVPSVREIKARLGMEQEQIKLLQERRLCFIDDDISPDVMLRLQTKSKVLSSKRNNNMAILLEAEALQVDLCGSEFDDIAAFIEGTPIPRKAPKLSKRALRASSLAKASLSSSLPTVGPSKRIDAIAKTLKQEPKAIQVETVSVSVSVSVIESNEMTTSAPSHHIESPHIDPYESPMTTSESAGDCVSDTASDTASDEAAAEVSFPSSLDDDSDDRMAKINGNVELFFIKNNTNWKRYVEQMELRGAEAAYQWALSNPSVSAVLTRFQKVLAAEGLLINFDKAFLKDPDSPCSESPSPCPSPSLSAAIVSTEAARVKKSWVDINEDATDSEGEDW